MKHTRDRKPEKVESAVHRDVFAAQVRAWDERGRDWQKRNREAGFETVAEADAQRPDA